MVAMESPESHWSPPSSARFSESDGAALVSAFESSGQRAADFCRTHGVSSARLSYWRKRVRGEAEVSPFVSARLTSSAASRRLRSTPLALEFVFPGGGRLSIRGVDGVEDVERLLTATRGALCSA